MFERVRLLGSWRDVAVVGMAAALWAAAGAGVAMGTAARAEDLVAKANAMYADVKPGKKTEDVLFAALAKMDAVPAAVKTRRMAMLLPASAGAFKAVGEWATATPQKEALSALKAAAAGMDHLESFAFSQGYGEQAAGGTERIKAGLFSDLGTPPMLAAMRPVYLERLDALMVLAHVEATRLAADGKPVEALSVVTDALFLARQVVDREFAIEQRWSYAAMEDACERLRDIAYVDTRGVAGAAPVAKLGPDDMIAANDRVLESTYLRTDLMHLPRAEELAVRQALEMSFEPGGGPKASEFATTMARLASTQQPLRLFAESARWESAAAGHPNLAETRKALEKVVGDWETRWPLDTFDARNSFPSDYSKLDRQRYAVLGALLPDLGQFFFARQSVQTQLVGTRTALALIGFQLRARNIAPDVPVVRPTFLKKIEDDGFSDDRARGRTPPLQYFVPVRDFGRGAPSKDPHALVIELADGGKVERKLDAKEFILYSVGPDKAKDFARRSHDRAKPGQSGDLLIWPPALSLQREDLITGGQLK